MSLWHCPNPGCHAAYSVGAPECPHCGTPHDAPKPTPEPAPAPAAKAAKRRTPKPAPEPAPEPAAGTPDP